MNKKSLAYKNIVLNTEFSKYLVEHPEVADKIPNNALALILPDDDPALCRENLALARRHREKDQAVVQVRVKKLAPPPKSRFGAAATKGSFIEITRRHECAKGASSERRS